LINNTEYDLFVTGDNADNARLFCEAALSRKPTGNYVILAGDRFDRNGFELKQHIDSILKPHVDAGRINILYETHIERWSHKQSVFEFEQVVSSYGTNIDAIISCNDEMGRGSLDVLRKYGAGEGIVITGQDATLSFVKGVYNGELTMTIYHPHKALGHQTAELVSQLLSGKKARNIANSETINGAAAIPTFKIKSVAVTRENLEEVLIKSGEFTLDQLKK
jgi:D-xylose transport system substrate-binding protein